MSMTSENVFLTALQPNTTVSTYAVPSETELSHGGTHAKEEARFKRVHQQVSMRLAEKSTLPRQNGSSSSQYAASESGNYPTMTKYSTMSQNFTPNFSSKSFVYASGRPMTAQRPSQYSSGYTSRSAIDFGPRTKISYTGGGGGGGGGAYYQEDFVSGGYQGGGFQGGSYQSGGGQVQQQQVNTMTRSFSRMGGDPETQSMHSMRVASMPRQVVSSWVAQDDSDGSLVSERDATYTQQASLQNMSNGYAANTYPRQSVYSTSRVNGLESGQQQVSSMTLPAMKSSLSGTLATGGGGGGMEQEVYVRQQSFKGPAHRTISRINNRQTSRTSNMSSGMYGTTGFSGSQNNLAMMQQGRLSRAGSVRSVHSVGRGKDVFDGMDMTGSMGNLSGLNSLDMQTAINYLEEPDQNLQMLGAAYIQHECYHNSDTKKQVNQLKGIPLLVQLFTSESQEVQRYATGATRNLIYESMDNKVALIESGGIPKLIEALKEQDDELHKNITGILWNLSSKDNLKERLARETLPELTEKILIPLSGTGDKDIIELSPSESDIFFNTTGCLRNLSSVNEKTRQQMRETRGLINALVGYVQKCLPDTKVEEKGVENAVCVLRNLSYQLYTEIPPSALLRLEGPSRAQSSSKGEAIGCFTPNSKKAKDRQNQDLTTFTEVSRQPTDIEWLWHPKIVELYNQVLHRCEINSTTREAAAGALQNITAGDKRWASILSCVALEQNRMLPVIMDLLRTNNDLELRSLTGFLRNLSRHAKDKNDMATKVVNPLLAKLPSDGRQKEPSSDVVLNTCGTLNNLVTSSMVAARDIAFFDGLPKLVGIKTSHDSSPAKLKAAKAAATVLSNMFQYKKLHKDYRSKGYQKEDFSDMGF
ncbi:plakophilin-3a isoform X2 [Sinocyclocheilus grahami]|uniref:Plakophilin-3-like n=2 Tax=Sinocyclocheilus grahami TaxID=75366 RepID=A0A672S234_SINGR|nr:PREDICTED: plakophilin-3-like isoform X1 [Sinocyclocheilus grahami]XP_016133193.1 PREDICTED: plakophilin-3-like isoform X2 [Sinocyclocheilus grahami]